MNRYEFHLRDHTWKVEYKLKTKRNAPVQEVRKKKTWYTGLYYFDKASWSPPSPILPKKEIITRPNIDPMPIFGLNLSSVWLPLHLFALVIA